MSDARRKVEVIAFRSLIAIHSSFGGLLLADPFGELREVITQVLTLVIQVIAVLLAVSIASGFLEAQLSFALGAPSTLSALWVKICAVVICLIVALTAVSISNSLVGILF